MQGISRSALVVGTSSLGAVFPKREGQGRESKIAAPEGGKEDKFIFAESMLSGVVATGRCWGSLGGEGKRDCDARTFVKARPRVE